MYAESHPSYGHSRLLFVLVAVATVLFLTVGKPLLQSMGIQYSSPGGSFIIKLHASTYVTLLALGVALFQRGGPLVYLIRRITDRRPVMIYLVIVTLIAAILFLRNGAAGLAYIIDTLIVPGVLALLLADISPANRSRLFRLVILLVLANALIAIGEAATRTHVVRPIFDFTSPFRANALLGHPLNNALITAPVMLFATGFGRLAAVMLLVAAMLAFGGRAAAALAAVFVALMLAIFMFQQLRQGRMPLQRLIAIPLLMLLVPVAVGVLWFSTNLAERLQTKLFFDSSAQARVNLFNVFDFVSTSEIWFGVTGRAVVELTEFIPKSNTIENFWVFMILQMGVVMFVPYLAGLLSFLGHLWRRTTATGRFAIVLFMLVASTNNSLTSKTPALAVLVLLTACARDYEQRPAARHHAVPADDLALGAA